MEQNIARKLLKVGEAFRIAGPFFNYEEVSQGNVNRTYKVNYIRDDGTGMAVIKPYLVQRVNTYAFKNPIQLMENIDKVTEYIREKAPDKVSLHYHHTEDENGERKTYLTDEDDSFWRICNYVPSVTFDSCDDIRVVRNAGEAFGEFQMLLSDFDATQLSAILTPPSFTTPFQISTIPASATKPCSGTWKGTNAAGWPRSGKKSTGFCPCRIGPAA